MKRPGPKHPKRHPKRKQRKTGRKIRKGARKGAKIVRKGGKTGEQVAPVVGAMTGHPDTGNRVGKISGHVGKVGNESNKLLK
jgi:hypothetical protein